jgi:hypothetical protein
MSLTTYGPSGRKTGAKQILEAIRLSKRLTIILALMVISGAYAERL